MLSFVSPSDGRGPQGKVHICLFGVTTTFKNTKLAPYFKIENLSN